MNSIILQIFKNKQVDFEKLRAFGFIYKDDKYRYLVDFFDDQFQLGITIDQEENIFTEVVDLSTGEPYTLFFSEGGGSFSNMIREHYKKLLNNLAEECFCDNVYKSSQARVIIDYIDERYNCKPEFLWEKFPEYSVFRRADNRKWFGALLKLPKCKLGIEGNELIEVINLRVKPDALDGLVDNENIFKGYHMNKKHWISVWLNGNLKNEKLFSMIDESFILVKK